ncbi:MAG: Crp/Fnr family transcriptional regulator [Alphaproteobacteria bacterium]|nr:Crp/Fnr family transcriptional regulator [Alphaproteobacteria bacterium]
MATELTPPSYEIDSLVAKLDKIASVSDAEQLALRQVPFRVRELADGEDIVREGAPANLCFLVLAGLVGRYKLLPSGKRQILSFHPPGDIPDLQSLLLRRVDHSICAFTRSSIALFDHAHLLELISRYPNIGTIFWRDTLIDAAIFREWIVGLGRRTAHGRIAHLLCEMAVRYRVVGIGNERCYPFPVTQAELADALGLTVVHVNRVLRALREDHIIRVEGGTVFILDRDRLWALAEFDPDYLHLDREFTNKLRSPASSSGGTPGSRYSISAQDV